MNKEKYIEDLAEIKDIMNRSTRFISLSGMSGIIAGLIALLGAYMAYNIVYDGQNYMTYNHVQLSLTDLMKLFSIAIGVLFLSIGSGILLTNKKAKASNQKLWDKQSKRLLINLLIPLTTGGIVCLILTIKGFIAIAAPLTLIFYGLSLINASKYTLSEIRSLGIIQIILGIIGLQFVGYGLILWSVGFGLMHILYGIMMHKKYGA